ncbi:Imm21 family immunity protein [Streptomyces chattanoogensis]|uniref:Uncharacterized protein n=1 Tax=Streptomyces chattanoogensis TaxID=66876 RepID=A0A0N0XWT1_9ACTN|nr:hypothetical protein ADL29_12415 [Streptomyces chattanoogensis]
MVGAETGFLAGDATTPGDYDRACAVDDLAGVIAVGGNGAQALVLADEWMTHLIGELKRAESTVRGCQGAIRTFCDYTASPHYQWPAECEARFGTHPVRASW